GNLNGSSSTYYTDIYYVSTATVRVVFRGYYFANANVGSRLAFRGKIVRAQSVAAYKAIREVA
ncbi:hypothetical protein, partial [Phocaeicola vulgatus]|uniref:hypothetical protein n=1 Tax=Phocaeicola vulgatus TaxID=821 RepID=UPI0034A1E323